VVERIRAMFDLSADPAEIARCLASDSLLAPRVATAAGLRVPGCWEGFELAAREALGQRLNAKDAASLSGRVARAFGRPLEMAEGVTHLFPTPEVLAEADLRGIGVTKARAEAVGALARAVRDGRICFGAGTGSESLFARLCEIPGIAKSTAQCVAMRALGEPDSFPSSDPSLLRVVELDSAPELERRAETWRPWRAYAAMYLWSIAAESSAAPRRRSA